MSPTIPPARRAEFAQAYAPIHEPFARYCAARCLGSERVEDVMQEAIACALEHYRDGAEVPERLGAYLVRIVQFRFAKRLRSREVQTRWHTERRRQLERQLPDDPTLALELADTLSAIDELPQPLREPLLLYAVSGFSIREVADTLDLREGAVKTRIHRARKELVQRLDGGADAASNRPTVARRLEANLATLSLLLLLLP